MKGSRLEVEAKDWRETGRTGGNMTHLMNREGWERKGRKKV